MRRCKESFDSTIFCRFFVPSIVSLRNENKLFLLCLSNGNADGLGRTREKELEKSCDFLGFAEAPTIIDDPDLQDGMDKKWGKDLIAEHINRYLTAKMRLGKESEIQILVTFDEYGISYHPNHMCVNQGVCKVISDQQFSLELFTLKTVHFLRKYISYADITNCEPDLFHLFTYSLYEPVHALALH